ncbi:hypothetical protein CAPTEDRAFT_161353 [Capitella teleta]|uniref:Dynein associated protein domain-containing protein n=2 Tax=Capitella teleta TaxID=283909 RepID=R7T8B1_CAPTE|nr:hypothetical protein CAPTEDRAFT_161353 [Capitella teleta]|eukprot:ELT87630.1 hypothetical protein CAPTEDRAFT_161353 [Capitella teleta]
MSDVAETLEMATLDKEMAEEKSESLQQEVDSQKEKIEELTLDLQIIKEEIENAGSDGADAGYQVKQLQQQNERLKEALVKLRDLSNAEKQETLRLQKQVERLAQESMLFSKDKERLQAEVEVYQEELIELKEHVDAAQGAEEMVEHLTEKSLQQEERLQELEEEKADLEALCEMNDELQETARDTELELREEAEMSQARVADANRRVEAMQESIAEYDRTINKFRELVAQLQDANRELRTQQVSADSSKQEQTPTIEFDFKAKFAETKAAAKAIDMELRRLDVQQANSHVTYLCAFMPDSFVKRGGDHDAVLVLLLVPRLIAKIELLIAQIKEKFEIPEAITREEVLKSHRTDGYSFANGFVHMLCTLLSVLKQYESAMNQCNIDLFLKIGTLLPELAVHEKAMDFLIEALRKDQLDENVSVEGLDKAINYFKHLYSVHLSGEKIDCTNLMSDQMRILLAATDSINMDIARLKHSLQSGQETSDISILLRDVENCSNEIKMAARKIKRRIPVQDPGSSATPLSFSSEVQDELTSCSVGMTNIVRVLQEISKAAIQQLATLAEGQGLQPKKIEELAFQFCDRIYGKDDSGPYDTLRQTCTETSSVIKKIATAMENGEYDFDGTQDKKREEPIPPVVARAQAVKAEFADSENLKIKLENKDEAIKDLKRQLRIKQEEISEQQVRVSLIEKKLENATKEGDDRVDRIQTKLDEAHMSLKAKEKEFEETMDALQQDIDTLETEKMELKERLRIISKKSLLEGLSRQSSQSGIAGLLMEKAGVSPAVSSTTLTSVKDSPMLIEQIESLKDALHAVKCENTRLMAAKMREQMSKLPPLVVPRKNVGLAHNTGHVNIADTMNASSDGSHNLQKLSKDTSQLLKELYKVSSCPKVVDISRRRSGVTPVTEKASPMNQLVESTANLNALRKMTTELQVQVTNMLAANLKGGQIRTDFSAFPTPSFAKALHERSADTQCLGRIQLPAKQGCQGMTIPIHLGPQQLKMVHSRIVS